MLMINNDLISVLGFVGSVAVVVGGGGVSGIVCVVVTILV